ncbi:energy transducer TonB [Sphingobium lactosutens]|uniref:energy transducer TonB family protein n=1 Tax=Sphingobium lactosutens TaxID=522773 RepID=UPI0015C11F2B|nr:TonB family protein [Sphingobium lactosutens]NWK94380.1 energy transducer TonB [Sphingobium lactosutens]
MTARSLSSKRQDHAAAYAERVASVTIIPGRPAPAHSRYSDQAMPLRTRLAGMGGVAGIGLLVLAGGMVTWRTYVAPAKPAPLSLFDIAPPAAPPEPVHEVPPGPEKVQKEEQKREPDRPKVEPPRIKVPSAHLLPVVAARPTPDPGPPVPETTAPQSQPVPSAPQLSTGKPTWEGLVLGALNKVKRYPRDAHFARQQGVPYIRFVMDREGKVISARLERSSGYRSLDQEALSLPKRAQPLPKPPEDVRGDTIELVVPVEFFMR